MKGIEFILLAAGAILGAYIRYKITSFPLILGIIGSNVLIVNIIGYQTYVKIHTISTEHDTY